VFGMTDPAAAVTDLRAMAVGAAASPRD
jgi:hypothetical protein